MKQNIVSAIFSANNLWSCQKSRIKRYSEMLNALVILIIEKQALNDQSDKFNGQSQHVSESTSQKK